MILDDQRSHLPSWADTVLADAEAAKYVSGIGVHWYAAAEDLLDHFGNLARTHANHPQTFILGTEACEGFLPWSAGPFPGDWLRGERYALDVMGDLNNFAVGWTDWNLCLDMSGGPNWVDNVCDAPILIDTPHSEEAAEGSVKVFYKQPMYYYFGHVAAFVESGATRLGISLANADAKSDQEHADSTSGKAMAVASEQAMAVHSPTTKPTAPPHTSAAFLSADGKAVIIVVMNRDDADLDVAVDLMTRGYMNVRMPPHSIRTFVLAADARS